MTTQVLARLPEEVAAARRFIDQALGEHAPRDDARLLVSELVTNAIRHGGDGKIVLSVTRHRDRVRVEVTDDGADGVPRWQSPGKEAKNGRGLLIVDKVSWRWGFVRDPHGTTVWFELPVTGPG
jgi:serine/threonine-protein kinase RsbW